MNQSELKEAKEHLTRVIAPTLTPNIRGLFQVRLLGLHRYHAEIVINIVNQQRKVLKAFGRQIIKVGDAVVVDQFSSHVTLAPNTPSVEAYFQAWLIGVNAENTEAEISLRLVDGDRKELINFGSTVREPGKAITLMGVDITATIIPKG